MADGSIILTDRTRETWTNDDWKLFRRANRFLADRKLRAAITCGHDLCPDPTIREVDQAGVLILRCGHLDRVVLRRAQAPRRFRYRR